MGGQVSINDFPEIYHYCRTYVKDCHHQQMATHYRQAIAEILKSFDNNQHSHQFYMILAWEGLRHSNIIEWRDLTTEDEPDGVDLAIENYIINKASHNCSND